MSDSGDIPDRDPACFVSGGFHWPFLGLVPVLVENCTIFNTHAHTKYKYLAGLYVRTIADRLAL